MTSQTDSSPSLFPSFENGWYTYTTMSFLPAALSLIASFDQYLNISSLCAALTGSVRSKLSAPCDRFHDGYFLHLGEGRGETGFNPHLLCYIRRRPPTYPITGRQPSAAPPLSFPTPLILGNSERCEKGNELEENFFECRAEGETPPITHTGTKRAA